MKANKKDIFKKIIKQAPADQPPTDFTNMVMNAIEADTQRELALKTLLQQQPADGPAFNFTANIMAQVTANAQRSTYRPIITSKGWYSIAAIISVFLVLIGLTNKSAHTGTSVGLTASALKYVNAVPTVFLIAFVGGVILLVVDYLITQRSRKTEAA